MTKREENEDEERSDTDNSNLSPSYPDEINTYRAEPLRDLGNGIKTQVLTATGGYRQLHSPLASSQKNLVHFYSLR